MNSHEKHEESTKTRNSGSSESFGVFVLLMSEILFSCANFSNQQERVLPGRATACVLEQELTEETENGFVLCWLCFLLLEFWIVVAVADRAGHFVPFCGCSDNGLTV